jgi:hypothetical protein
MRAEHHRYVTFLLKLEMSLTLVKLLQLLFGDVLSGQQTMECC